ncbi:MAG: NHLP family bacteriocin export ABC transporter peptidase/permease/ATPase subunit [Lachnospiraceae bacterium]|nr:NHLP family bacteriocin export ABC transporter peptidase/permease/ATPase subunit [Lachnospiraceae bacterium]
MNKSIKKPLEGKVAKVPVIMQLEALECGAASLTMVLAYYDKWVPLEEARVQCGVSRDGVNAKNILFAARHYGLNAKGYRLEPEELKKHGQFPCIIHWEFRHFVVLNGFRGQHAIINDPARGTVKVPMADFDRSFTGVCLFMEPSETFVADGEPKSMASFVKRRLQGNGSALAFSMLLSLVAALIGIISPMFDRVFWDRILPGQNPTWVTPFFIFLSLFTLIELVVSVVQTIFALKLEGRLAVKANAQYMWHILRLPVTFFSQRMSGDIAQRKTTNESIASTLINTLVPTVLNIIMMGLYLTVILRYSVLLSLVGIGGILINILTNRYLVTRQIAISRVMMRDQANLTSTAIAGIEMIETIKATGAENGFFRKWAGYHASVNVQAVDSTRISQYFSLITQTISVLVDKVILFIGLFLIIEGEFTIGTLMAFQSVLMSFSSPVMQLASVFNTIRTMRNNMERIDDVLEYPEDEIYEQEQHPAETYEKLSGRLEMRHVSFGYSPLMPPLIEDFNLTVEPGRKVAFVGSSGCGKSTLAKLISGLEQPWSGEILFDGKPIKEIDRNIFTGSLAVVDQDITLFEDTIADNIKMWDHSIEDYEMILAARDASLHDDIMEREGGYLYKMQEGGRDFSGGQRQRLEIARVLAQGPTIIIMDEATSALDAQTEYDVVRSIKDQGITSIVIAHRLSTIRDCDEIIVMDHGKIVERGTHEELMARHGMYEALIMSE